MEKQLPQERRTAAPEFSAHVCCDQTAEWIKMLLGMEVGLGPGYIVLDGDPAPTKGHNPQFSAHVCCDQTAKMPLGTEVDQGHCVRWGSSSPKKGHNTPDFWACVYCGQTVAHLSYC